MKKIIIVNNNMKVGGVQKSLHNLLWSIEKEYDITLFLFSAAGAYLDKLPPGVKVVQAKSLLRYLGVSQAECSGIDKLRRGILAAVCKAFGRPVVMKLMLASQKTLEARYDCAISFLHNGNRRSFYGGVQDFVLNRIKADRKIAFLHCDYRHCGADHPENNRAMACFDTIAACSDGCARAFREVLPELGEKCVTVRNCHRFAQIMAMAEEEPVIYGPEESNVVMVSRLSHEKGLERAVEAAAYAIGQGAAVKLHLIGNGPMKEPLRALADRLGIKDRVILHGEQENPYRFMKNADLLMLTSFHEAAPMVIEEALCMGLPVLTVETTSSTEMVTQTGGGWVCENSQEALNRTLARILLNRDLLKSVRSGLCRWPVEDDAGYRQFTMLIEG